MHELQASYRQHFRTAFILAIAVHAVIIGGLSVRGLWPQEPMLVVRMFPYQGVDMLSVRERKPASKLPEPPPAPRPPPAKPPREKPPEVTGTIVPVPDWLKADTSMMEMPLAPEQPIAAFTQAEHAGHGEGRQEVAGEGEAPGPGDRKPRLLKRVKPVYPRIARLTGVEGLVVLSLYIDEAGHVLEAKVIKSLGNTGCDEAAVRAAMQWRFTPALRRRKPVPAWITAPVLFRLDR